MGIIQVVECSHHLFVLTAAQPSLYEYTIMCFQIMELEQIMHVSRTLMTMSRAENIEYFVAGWFPQKVPVK